MIRRDLHIGRWDIEFYFADNEYDIDVLIDRLYDFGAPVSIMKNALQLMELNKENTGFTFTNPDDKCAIVAIGPSSDGSEFINTLTHEIHHVAVAIANGLGVDLESETPAYISGDAAKALAKSICEFGCKRN